MQKKGSCRSDFISDGSSSDDELPDLGSLRERLARKRPCADVTNDLLGHQSSLTSCVSGSGCTTYPEKPHCSSVSGVASVSTSHNSNIFNDDRTKDYFPSVSKTNSITENATSEFSEHGQEFNVDSDSDGDAEEQLSLSQILNRSSDNSKQNFSKPGSSKSGHAHVSSEPATARILESKVKKKRTQDEIQENKRKAQEKKEERDRLKMAKEAEKEMRKAERESKKQFSLATCLQYIKVLVDTNIVNTCGLGVVIFKTCEELGVKCEARELPLPFTIMWYRQVSQSNISENMKVETVHSELEEREILTIVPVLDFIQMVDTFKQKQKGLMTAGITLRDYVNQMKSCLPDKTISIIVPGIEQYFRDLKSQTNQKFKKAVQGTNAPQKGTKGSKMGLNLVAVSRVDIEETITDTLLQTDVSTFMLETPDDVADFVRRFSKAVAERPAKKDRFDPVFSFHEEGSAAVKVDKHGGGLLKVWKQQLLQFKNISPDVAQAIIAEYPSPLHLVQTYSKCSTEKEAIGVLENIVIRRGAGVLGTARRIGKELSRRIYTFFTCDQPDFVIK